MRPADAPYLTAIGALTIHYAELESVLMMVAGCYLRRVHYSLRKQILVPMNNSERAALVRMAANEIEKDERVRDLLLYFLRCFSICGENRNIAAHATGLVGESHLHMRKRATSAPFAENSYPVTLADLRSAADATLATVDFGWRLERYITVRSLRNSQPDGEEAIELHPCPEKPPRPRKLDPHPLGSIHPDDPIPF